MRVSQTPSPTRRSASSAAAGRSPPWKRPGARSAASPGRSGATPGCCSSIAASTGLEGPRVAVGVGGVDLQLGTATLRVTPAHPAAYAGSPGRGVAGLHDVGGEDRRRQVGGQPLVGQRRDHRPVRAPDDHHSHLGDPHLGGGDLDRVGPAVGRRPRPGTTARPGAAAPTHAAPRSSADATGGGRAPGRLPTRRARGWSAAPRSAASHPASPPGRPGPRTACGAGRRASRPSARRPGPTGGRPPRVATSISAAVTSSHCSPGSGTSTVRPRSTPSATGRLGPEVGHPHDRAPAPGPRRAGHQREGEGRAVDGVAAAGAQLDQPGQRRVGRQLHRAAPRRASAPSARGAARWCQPERPGYRCAATPHDRTCVRTSQSRVGASCSSETVESARLAQTVDKMRRLDDIQRATSADSASDQV